jgi:alpha-glucosidase
VFEEVVTFLPEEYNVYGLGETIHALRLGNNFTKTMWNADSLDAVDRNIYGTHPVYFETRYYNEDGTYLPWSKANSNSVTTSASY